MRRSASGTLWRRIRPPDPVPDSPRQPLHVSADRLELLHEPVVAPVDVVGVGHHGLALGPQPGDDERGPRADVVGPNRRAGEPLDAHHIDRGYDRFVEKLQAIGADVERT